MTKVTANKWVIDSTGIFKSGGFFEPTPGDGELVVTLPDETMPDPATERYDPTSPSLRRLATSAELATAQAAEVDANVTVQAALRGIRATVAYVYRIKNGAWPTASQLDAELAVWKTAYKNV